MQSPPPPRAIAFFIAVCETAGLPKTPKMLRNEVCDYLEEMIDWFEHSVEGGRPALQQHIQKMRKPGVWATALEVTVASHLLSRPIHLITDSTQPGSGGTLPVGPPAFIAASAWGPTVYLAHFLNWHFEGTTMAPTGMQGSSSSSSVQPPPVPAAPTSWGGPTVVLEDNGEV